MKPPKTINVLDRHAGFTAITKSPTYVKIINDGHQEREATSADYQPKLIHRFVRWERVWREYNTLWRPGYLLAGKNEGLLQEFDEHSSYQNNKNVTRALYKVKGYPNRVVLWFDNITEERIGG